MRQVLVAWITYQPIDAVKLKIPINKMVDFDEKRLTQIFNTNLHRVVELNPEAADELDLIRLEGEHDDTIQY